ncbi:YadA-like family protein, partial [Psychrobacter sp. UBA3480]
TNETMTTEVGRLDAANQAQDAAVATDQARQDTVIAANNQSSIERDTALSNTVAANDKAVNARVDSTNETMTTEVGRLDATNQAQDAAMATDQARQDTVIAQNKADADAKNVATNERITTETGRLDAAITVNNDTINSRIDSTNETMTTEVSRLDGVNTAQDAAIKAKADASYVDTMHAQQEQQITAQTIRNDNFAAATAEMLGAGASYDSEAGTMLAPSYSIGGNVYSNVGDAFSATDARIDSLEGDYRELRGDMKELGYKLSAGIASNAAMEVAPFVPGKVSYAMGMSHFNGEAAIGGTLRHTSVDGKVSMIGGFSTNTQSENLFKIGISGVID